MRRSAFPTPLLALYVCLLGLQTCPRLPIMASSAWKLCDPRRVLYFQKCCPKEVFERFTRQEKRWREERERERLMSGLSE
ncbi:hypothetical protein NDU88_002939 [Pleurodeles waltl]|uniref:Secreted protein n=1 Tax=Pleurodeles waltl TaxID=8319 RepID=A0AAV7TM30_PLEWA|nr:hypothetical protein NDU88_002939 [Pleurodeles waltl]